ncbi:hypothetical protein AB6A23_11045 [Paenibacillus tarimensis]
MSIREMEKELDDKKSHLARLGVRSTGSERLEKEIVHLEAEIKRFEKSKRVIKWV